MRILTIERVLLAGVICVTSAAWTGRVTAQASQTSPDVLSALLGEVRGLRVAMEQMASAGPRVQLFASRLQLQETRINNMLGRLTSVRDSLASAQREFARVQGQQKQLEAALAEHRSSAAASDREEAKQAELMLEEGKRTTAALKSTIDRLAAEEAQLAADIGAEQARWSEINNRLDELERLLSKKQ